MLTDDLAGITHGDSPGPVGDEFVNLVEAALRRLNKPAALVTCELLGCLPRTLTATMANWPDPRPVDPTPLDRARALREVLVAAIDRLQLDRPQADRARPQAMLEHDILYWEYVRGMPTKAVMAKLDIREAMLHRRRRDGVAILAQDLRRHEELLDPEPHPHSGPVRSKPVRSPHFLGFLWGPGGLLLVLWGFGAVLFLVALHSPSYAVFWSAANLLFAAFMGRGAHRN